MTMKATKTTSRRTRRDYLDWLFHQVDCRQASGLEEFICELHALEFYCVMPNDDNRVQDGLQLRDRYLDIVDPDHPEFHLTGPCTVLEMLVALANRMDFILFDEAKGSQTPKWFWLFIDNLKLQKYDSGDQDAERKKKLNRIILRKFVKRQYQSDGRGGLFPLNNPSHDQRNVEIWYQMMDYIGENFDI